MLCRCGDFTGTTAKGSPIQYFRFGAIDPKQLMSVVTEAEFRTFYVWWMEQSQSSRSFLLASESVSSIYIMHDFQL